MGDPPAPSSKLLHADVPFSGMHKYLCERCQSFRLRAKDFIEGREDLVLGTRDEILARTRYCSLCRLVAHCLNLHEGWISRKPDKTYGLVWDYHPLSATRNYDHTGSDEDSEYCDEATSYMVPYGDPFDSDPMRCLLVPCGGDFLTMGARSTFLTAQTPATIESPYDSIKRWVTRCSAEHHECNQQNLWTQDSHDSLNTILVVDIKRGCLVDIPTAHRYFALSYVWGKEARFQTLKSNEADLRKPGALKAMQHLLPKTIKDAIEVLLAINEPYLWCDRLCIVQDDAGSKHELISHMDQIYGSAHVVMVARSGEHADIGLFGRHPWHKVERIADEMRFVAVPEYNSSTFTRVAPLEDRAWTYVLLIYLFKY